MSSPTACSMRVQRATFGAGTAAARGRSTATWARKDVPILRASQHSLGDPALDQQGRVSRMDHSAFVVFNVHAPCIVGTAGQTRREAAIAATFHVVKSLGTAMDAAWAEGKRVIICGDLNLTHRALDQRAGVRLFWVDGAGCVSSPEGRIDCGPQPEWRDKWRSLGEICKAVDSPGHELEAIAECIHAREGPCTLVDSFGVAIWQSRVGRRLRRGAPIGQGSLHVLLSAAAQWAVLAERLHHRGPDDFRRRSSSSLLPGATQGAGGNPLRWLAWRCPDGVSRGEGLRLHVDDMRLNIQFPPQPARSAMDVEAGPWDDGDG